MSSGSVRGELVNTMRFDPSYLLGLASKMPGTVIQNGLSPQESEVIESLYGVRFPPDLRAMLTVGLPYGDRWPDWRAAASNDPSQSISKLHESLDWPLRGMLFDIEHNSFWDPHWGPRPASLEHAQAIATRAVHAAPRLIQVSGHRYLPAEPCIEGNPVLSVWQTDIIVYGKDLEHYFQIETKVIPFDVCPSREIRCWTRWADDEECRSCRRAHSE